MGFLTVRVEVVSDYCQLLESYSSYYIVLSSLNNREVHIAICYANLMSNVLLQLDMLCLVDNNVRFALF